MARSDRSRREADDGSKRMTPWVGALAGAALILVGGCGHRNPDACTVTCAADSSCPEGLSCAVDGYCHADDETGSCNGVPFPDASPDGPDGRDPGDGDPCQGAASALADSDTTDVSIPDGVAEGVDRTLSFATDCVTVQSIQVRVEIVHQYRGDIEIRLTSPGGDTEVLLNSSDDSRPDVFATFFPDVGEGTSADGDWVLNVSDVFQTDVGTLQFWSIGINQDAP
jgi:hypothetical protein